MAAWMRLDASVRGHRKIRRLGTALGIGDAHARGLVVGLWAWALVQAPGGDLGDLGADELAEACGWDGDAHALLVGLLDVGLLDGQPGELAIHGWDDYQGAASDAARQRKHREKSKMSRNVTTARDTCHDTSHGMSRPVTPTIRYDTIRTIPVSDRASHDPHPPRAEPQAGKADAELALVLAAADRLAKIRPEAEPPPQAPPTGRASKAGAGDAARASYADQAREVWSHYRERWHPRVAPDLLPGSHEYRAICDRLREGSSVADLRDAIDGCHGDPWHQGANDKGAKYLSITLICRSASHVQRYRELLARPARAMSAHETQAMSAAQRFINGSG